MLLDYHSHTNLTRTNHAVGSMEEYVEQAVARGLTEFGFSEHLFISQMNDIAADDKKFEPLIQLFNTYTAKIEELRERYYPRIILKSGIEIDYAPDHTPLLQKILAGYSFDYIIGSIHYLEGWGFDNPNEIAGYTTRDINQIYLQYLAELERCAQSGLVDIIGHLDLVKIFGYRPTKDVMSAVEQTVKTIARMNLTVEINTAGLRKPVREIYPHADWLQLCYHYRIPITLGSDAHQPKDVGADLEQAVALAKSVGYTQLATYTQRNRTLVPLE
ncbi:MAG: histidinol-phosphatase HisJ family protein [bacterium]|nr:histidinol-phosphatase HisJ family protein [bacterium]